MYLMCFYFSFFIKDLKISPFYYIVCTEMATGRMCVVSTAPLP